MRRDEKVDKMGKTRDDDSTIIGGVGRFLDAIGLNVIISVGLNVIGFEVIIIGF